MQSRPPYPARMPTRFPTLRKILKDKLAEEKSADDKEAAQAVTEVLDAFEDLVNSLMTIVKNTAGKSA